MNKKPLLQKSKEAFLNAPADKMLPAIFIVTVILSGCIGAVLGGRVIYSSLGGLALLLSIAWYFARKARLSRERTAKEYAR